MPMVFEKIASQTFDLINDRRLATREMECLYWAAEGKTVKETAIILGVSAVTIHDYRRSILQKLNCSKMAQAVAKALRSGLLQ